MDKANTKLSALPDKLRHIPHSTKCNLRIVKNKENS